MMRRPTRLGLAAGIGAALLLPTAGAALPDGPDPTPCIGAFEGEKAGYLEDDRIDETEFERIRGDWFLVWDTDRSGDLAEHEFTSCYDRIGLELGDGAELHRSWDLDRDHVLRKSEFFGPDVYLDLDADDSGFLDPDEFIR